MGAADWKIKAITALSVVIAFFTTGAACLSAWWLWGPVDSPYVPINVSQHSASQIDGHLMMRRQFEIQRRGLEITVNRELVRRAPNGDLYRIALPSSSAVYADMGRYNLERMVELPANIRPGVYELHNTLRWRANPLREASMLLPIVLVEIK